MVLSAFLLLGQKCLRYTTQQRKWFILSAQGQVAPNWNHHGRRVDQSCSPHGSQEAESRKRAKDNRAETVQELTSMTCQAHPESLKFNCLIDVRNLVVSLDASLNPFNRKVLVTLFPK